MIYIKLAYNIKFYNNFIRITIKMLFYQLNGLYVFYNKYK